MARKKSVFNYKQNLSASQNFLTSRKLLKHIVNLSTIEKSDLVFEIGTGKGHLTEVLSRASKFVNTIEIDEKLFKVAHHKLADIKNVRLTLGDFLECSLPGKGEYKVFSNIPYFITTQVVEKLTTAKNPPTDIWLCVEKGAAKRFMGIPNQRKKSLLLKVNWKAEIIYYFRREDFHPKPSVDSVLLHLARKDEPDLNKTDYNLFEQFVDHSLKHGLLSNAGLLTKRQVRTALKLEQLPPLETYDDPRYEQWLCLFKCYKKFYKS
jgi:23S rRNA (adenine-N6)-dimethyltransferase